MSKSENPIIILVIVLVLVFLGWWALNKSSTPVAENNGTQEVTPTEDTSDVDINASTPAASISYANALVTYKNARLQLAQGCQASPDKMTFKNNALMMVDNRDPVSHTVKIGSTFSVKGYGFKIIKLTSATLPATWLVDCGTSQNVSTVLIEK